MRELREIIAEAKDLVTEACAAGYSDGVQMGLDMAIDKRDAERGELCDAFIRVWNERYELKEELEELRGIEPAPPNYLGDEFVYCSECVWNDRYERNGANERLCARHQIADPGDGYCYWGERK